jgi:hypothetical protein
MPTIFRNLNSGKHLLIQSTLRLLVAMVMHGHNTTRELLEKFNFSLKAVNSFLSIRKKNIDSGVMREDIRTLYIRFIFGFIIRGDSFVRKTILETKNLIFSILKEIHLDPLEVLI